MKMWIGKLCAVMVVGLVFLGVGYKLGESKTQAVVAAHQDSTTIVDKNGVPEKFSKDAVITPIQ